MKVLCGGPVSESQDVFDAHIKSLRLQGDDLYYKGIDNSPTPLIPPAGFRNVDWKYVDGLGNYKTERIRWKKSNLRLVGDFRNEMRDAAIAGGYTHLFMTDSDIIFGLNILNDLLKCEKDFIAPLVWTKSAYRRNNWFSNAWTIKNNKQAPCHKDLNEKLKSGGIHEIEMTGCCYLVSVEALRCISWKLQRGTMSEDVSVAKTCQKAGIPIYIYCDGAEIEHRRIRK